MLTRFGDFDRSFTMMDQLRRRMDRLFDDYDPPRGRDTLRGNLADEADRSLWRGRFPRLTLSDAGASLLLRAELLRVAGWHRHGEDVILARERHLIALREALARVEAALDARHALELMAEELRLAQEAVNEITGEFTPDDLLGVIFSRFCIGK